jgi:phosphatidylglycerophosphatase GEP4
MRIGEKMVSRAGQLINIPGILAPLLVLRHPSWAIPHYGVETINGIDFERAARHGIKGAVFDKDNTLTGPLVEGDIHPDVADKFYEAVNIFGAEDVLVSSNSIGSNDDLGYEGAAALETRLDNGVRVLRRGWLKKPAGKRATQEALSHPLNKYMGIGDRVFTDIVFGNRCGMLTIRVNPFTSENDIKGVSGMRRLEGRLIEALHGRLGVQAPAHELYNPSICVGSHFNGRY